MNGEPTVALFTGAVTVTPVEVGVGVGVGAGVGAGVGVGVGAGVVVPLPTVIATLVTHDAPELPQAFTCTVCAPAGAVTDAATVVLFTIVVLLLLSSE